MTVPLDHDKKEPLGLKAVRAIVQSPDDVSLPESLRPAPAPLPIEVTEDGVARAFSAKYAETMRYDHDLGAWFCWTGTHWRQDRTSAALDFCRELAREASQNMSGKALATARKAGFAGGVERLARADRRHAVTQETWDTDPWLLGTPSGTVDLRTGSVGPHQPSDHITKLAAVGPDEHEACPLWHRFLEDATGGDGDLVTFLAQWVGYCLTGDTREQSLVFIHGDGGNGKGVFINTVQGLLADYAKAASMATFVKTSSDRHPTDLAALRGARLVTASETEDGRAWDETRIKNLTGGDRIAARFMRQDFFEYQPQFKLTILGNHRPALSSVDSAMRRRFLIVPFRQKPSVPDRQLEEKLRAEWPGILRWAINGCLEWQENGLMRPASVMDATEDYFAAQDVFGQWLAEDCRIDPGKASLFETSKALYESWQAFARAAGEDPGTAKRFGDALAKRGITRETRRVNGKPSKVWSGIGLSGMIYRESDHD